MGIVGKIGADRPGDRGLIDCEESLPANFARVVAAHGSRNAIGAGTWQLTYDELNIAANRVAHALLSRGGSAGDRIAILMAHDGPLVGAILAVHKVGRIAVVLNPSHPPNRLSGLVEDAGTSLILTDMEHRDLATQAGGQNCGILLFEDHFANGPTHDPDIRVSADATAVLVYTSGSTGRPKAVMLPHRQVIHNVGRHAAAMRFTPEDRIPLFGSPSGAQGFSTTWCALLHGASLHPFPIMERGVTGLADWVRNQRITAYISSASIFRQFVKTLGSSERFSFVRAVRLASETATSDDFRAFQRLFSDECEFVHTLASSETGNICQVSLTRRDTVPEGRLAVGRPPEGIEILLLDDEGRPVASGEAGNVVVRSRYLASGYWRNEALTAERFSDEPGSGMRTFRGGDKACINADGMLEFRGRVDAQVKVRGYRVDLSEVTEALLGVPAVERAVALPRVLPSSDTQLVAYLTTRDGHSISAATVRRALRAVLPSQMVPSAFVFVDSFPLTISGKIDREKLLLMSPPAAQRTADAPMTETETLVAEFWRELLELPEVGRQDDFFDLGGDSLTAAVVAARVYDALQVELNLGAFTDNATLAALAAVIDGLRRAGNDGDRPPLVRVSREQPLPLSFHQERIWRHSQTLEENAGYVMSRCSRLTGPLDAAVLRQCLDYLARRHEILRTTFASVNGRPVQIIHSPEPVTFEYFDLGNTSDATDRATLICKKEAVRVFDLAEAPLMRFTLIRIRENEHWLQRVNHHILSDGWSWNVYTRELAVLYEAKVRGEVPPLPEFESLQYADYSVWQRKAQQPERPSYRAAVEWWKDVLRKPPRPFNLPFKRKRPVTGLDATLGTLSWGVLPETTTRLDELRRTEAATYFMVRLAAFVALLATSTGARDVIIGSYLSNRNRIALQNMFGFFSNLATLRFRFDPSRTFREWLSEVRKIVTAAEAHGDIPYDELRKELSAQRMPLPAINVIVNSFTAHPMMRFADIELTFMERRDEVMPWGFSMRFEEQDESRNCQAHFDAGIHDPAGVREFVESYKRLLDLVSRVPDRPIGELLAN